MDREYYQSFDTSLEEWIERLAVRGRAEADLLVPAIEESPSARSTVELQKSVDVQPTLLLKDLESVATGTPDIKMSENVNRIVRELVNWAAEQPIARVAELEKSLARIVLERKALSPALGLFCAELNQVRRDVLLTDELTKAIEQTEQHTRLYEFIAALASRDDNAARLTTHKLLDFLGRHVVTTKNLALLDDIAIQDGERSRFNPPAWRSTETGIFMSLGILMKHLESRVKTYLMAAHIHNVRDSLYSSEKQDAIVGMPGGSDDATIYTFKYLRVADNLRRELHLTDGYPIANPVFPIAPGYLGYYRAGQLERVYREPGPAVGADILFADRNYVSNNKPEDEYIYDVLNDNEVPSDYNEKIYGMDKLHDIRKFTDMLRESGREFYFDFHAFEWRKLHPLVLAEIVMRNDQYRRRHETVVIPATPLSQEEVEQVTFPFGNVSAERKYEHSFLLSLGMRKRMSDGLGFDVATLDLALQRNLLHYFSQASINDIEYGLKPFIKQWGQMGLKTFLALESEPNVPWHRVFEILQRADPAEAYEVFARFGECVDEAYKTRDYLRTVFSHDPTYTEADAEKVAQQLLRRGSDLLVKFVRTADGGVADPHIVAAAYAMRADLLLFALAFKVASERAIQQEHRLDFADIKNTEFIRISSEELTGSEKTIMRQMFVANRQRDEYPAELIEATRQKFENYLTDPDGQFYLLTHKGEVVAFVRFAPNQSTKRIHVDSLNVRPEIRGSSLGSAMLKAALDRYTADGYTIEGEAYTKNPMLKHYLSDFGFRQIGEPYIYPGTNELFIKLERSPEKKVEAIPEPSKKPPASPRPKRVQTKRGASSKSSRPQ